MLHLVRAPRSAAHLDGIDVTFGDAARDYRDFAAGRLDVSLVPPARVGEASTRYGRSGFRPYLAVLFYGFNLKDPTFGDVRFREAVVRAIDRKAKVESHFSAKRGNRVAFKVT